MDKQIGKITYNNFSEILVNLFSFALDFGHLAPSCRNKNVKVLIFKTHFNENFSILLLFFRFSVAAGTTIITLVIIGHQLTSVT